MRKILNFYKKNMGLDLPSRELKLNFNVPAPVARNAEPDLTHLPQLEEREDQLCSVEYFRLLKTEIRKLNHCRMSTPKRRAYTEDLLNLFYPQASGYTRKYAHDGGVPEPESRQEYLDLITDITSRLLDSYKLIYKSLYLSSNFRLARSIEQLELSAFRILELSKFKQRIKGQRYQVLSENAWRTVNSVFHSMLAFGRVDVPHVVLESAYRKSEEPELRTLRDFFLAMQMLAKFGILRWPTEWHAYVESIGKSDEILVDLHEDGGENLNRHMSIAYAYDHRPSRFSRAENHASLGPASIIRWEKLNRKVTSDFLYYFAGKQDAESDTSKKLAMLSYNESLSIAKLQLQGLRGQIKFAAPSENNWTVVDIRLYIGFKDVYQLLQAIHYPVRDHAVGERLIDQLAQRSAMLAEDHIATHESIWSTQPHSDQIFFLKTQETPFTTSMKIGSLIAYGMGSEGVKNPSLGVIARIYRPSAKTVVIDLEKLGEIAEPVWVTTDMDCINGFSEDNKNILGGILVKDQAGSTKLLVPPQSTLREHSQLVMKSKEQLQFVWLEKIVSVTRSYFCFQLGKIAARSGGTTH